MAGPRNSPDRRARAVPELRLVDRDDVPSALAPTLDDAYRQYSRYVGFIVYRMLGRDENLDDIVQEVFLAAAHRFKYLRDPSAAKTWLATVAVRKARHQLRLRRLRAALGLDREYDYREIADLSKIGRAHV